MFEEKSSLDPRSTALFLDLDGTLIDIAPSPDAVRAPKNFDALLHESSQRLGGALAILSGRPISFIDSIAAPLRLPAAGVHGAEWRRAPGGPVIAAAPPLPQGLVEAVCALAVGHEGLIVEQKTYSVAIHYRAAPDQSVRLEAELSKLLARQRGGPALVRGRQVFEVMPRQATKGAALRAFMDAPPFAGRRPIMIGDDTTDETAMAVAESLGGKGLRVAGEHFSTANADFVNPAAVLAWLRNFANGEINS